MKASITFSECTAAEIQQLLQVAAVNGATQAPPSAGTSPAMAAAAPPPAAPAPAAAMPPPAQAPVQPVTPPQPVAPPAAAANPKQTQVLTAMNGYANVYKVEGVRKVLGRLSLTRVQDANDQQLDWLLSVFSNTAITPDQAAAAQ